MHIKSWFHQNVPFTFNLRRYNTVNWLSQNTFGALPAEGTKMRNTIDKVAGVYRSFLDALPYRRQDGRAARALPKGRSANAFAEWEAFKSGDEPSAGDESAVVGGRDALLRVGLALYHHVLLQSKHGSIDDSQYGGVTTKTRSIDDGQYSPSNQSDTRE